MFGVLLIARVIEISKYELLAHFLNTLADPFDLRRRKILPFLCPSFRHGYRTSVTVTLGRSTGSGSMLIREITKTIFCAFRMPLHRKLDSQDQTYIFKSLQILKFSEIYFFQVGTFIYSYKIGLLPNVFKGMLLMTNQAHSYNTRNSNTFYLFPARTNKDFLV